MVHVLLSYLRIRTCESLIGSHTRILVPVLVSRYVEFYSTIVHWLLYCSWLKDPLIGLLKAAYVVLIHLTSFTLPTCVDQPAQSLKARIVLFNPRSQNLISIKRILHLRDRVDILYTMFFLRFDALTLEFFMQFL